MRQFNVVPHCGFNLISQGIELIHSLRFIVAATAKVVRFTNGDFDLTSLRAPHGATISYHFTFFIVVFEVSLRVIVKETIPIRYKLDSAFSLRTQSATIV